MTSHANSALLLCFLKHNGTYVVIFAPKKKAQLRFLWHQFWISASNFLFFLPLIAFFLFSFWEKKYNFFLQESAKKCTNNTDKKRAKKSSQKSANKRKEENTDKKSAKKSAHKKCQKKGAQKIAKNSALKSAKNSKLLFKVH